MGYLTPPQDTPVVTYMLLLQLENCPTVIAWPGSVWSLRTGAV